MDLIFGLVGEKMKGLKFSWPDPDVGSQARGCVTIESLHMFKLLQGFAA